MANKAKENLLKFGVPSLAVLVIAIQFFFMETQRLNAWKGGGYGMYTEIHYYYNQIHIPGLSVDSLITDRDMKASIKRLKVMPNDDNLKETAELVLKITHKDSVLIQIWKPTISSKNGVYSRVLVNEIHLKNPEL